jgi:coenzyme PQQ synthesis protein D (PqqD)
MSESRIRRSAQVVARELGHDDGGVLLHLESGNYHGLNPSGWKIWCLIDGERTAGELVTELRARLDDAPPQLEEEVGRFLEGLRERDLIA